MELTTPFAEDMGRLLELGFITGLLTSIEQHDNVTRHYAHHYEEDLHSLRFQPIYTTLCDRMQVMSTWDKEALERWALFMLERGYLAGLNFFREYLASFSHEYSPRPRTIVYLQCNLYGQNSLGTYAKNERTAIQELMEQFRVQEYPLQLTEEERLDYSHKGNFLRADVLMLLHYGRQWRILSIDVSVFALRSLQDAGDLTDVERIRHLLASEMHYTRSKSVFSQLSIDTDTETTATEILAGQLRHYFTAFKRKDKETLKLIQAASYAYNFYEFLIKKQILTAQDAVTFNVFGYTDRAVNAMALNQKLLPVLATCAAIYKQALSEQDIHDERLHVLDTIRKAASKSFHDGKTFVHRLVSLADQGDGTHWYEHKETLTDFVNTCAPLDLQYLDQEIKQRLTLADYEGRSIQQIHATLTKQELESSTPYIFLTGSPGIGKTTAIVSFLKERSMEGEGFLFLYASPRKQVNLDIIKKFREDEFGLRCDHLLALTTNSIIIRSNKSRPTVHYYSKERTDRFSAHGIEFLHMESQEAQVQRTRARKLEEIQEGLLIDKGESVSGVLESLCTAIYAALDAPLSNAIVATVAIQSLRRTHQGKQSTLRHLDKIFQGVRSTGKGILPGQMQKVRQNIKYIFIMIDEVTGDESGVAFVDGIHTFLQKHELLQQKHGINTKIIVADASIVDPRIIRQHVSETTYEPDKIYFQRVPQQKQRVSLSREEFQFKHLPAVAINANSYPASALHITYKVGIDALQYDEETYTERSKQLSHDLHEHILADILLFLGKTEATQILVYIQDKQRLAQLIRAIRKSRDGHFELSTDYLEIHANISEEEKKSIERFQDTVKVVFMTASASRGLSFKRAQHILIHIPNFEVEQNLMEVLQVMYRGRGGELDLGEKALTFYLSDRILYTTTDDRDLSARESMLHLLNVLLILKTAVMTRIVGSGQIGRNQHFLMVPIGGKSVLAAGDSFTARMGKLIKELQGLAHRFPDDKRLTYVSTTLTRILNQAHIRLLAQDPTQKKHLVEQSYIPLIPDFTHTFHEAARKGFDYLLKLPPFEQGYLAGGMLIVPLQNYLIQENYWMDVKALLEEPGRKFDLLTALRDLSHSPRYHEGIRLFLGDAHAFVERLQQMSSMKSMHYEQESDHVDQHYAVPLLAFLAPGEMKIYFEQHGEDEESSETAFRLLLAAYVHAFYPIDSVLPISKQYRAFPYLVFRSFNLAEARHKMFSDKYLFMSHELNILNMLLSSKSEE